MQVSRLLCNARVGLSERNNGRNSNPSAHQPHIACILCTLASGGMAAWLLVPNGTLQGNARGRYGYGYKILIYDFIAGQTTTNLLFSTEQGVTQNKASDTQTGHCKRASAKHSQSKMKNNRNMDSNNALEHHLPATIMKDNCRGQATSTTTMP